MFIESLEFKSVVKKIMIPVQVKNEIQVEESRTNPKDDSTDTPKYRTNTK